MWTPPLVGNHPLPGCHTTSHRSPASFKPLVLGTLCQMTLSNQSSTGTHSLYSIVKYYCIIIATWLSSYHLGISPLQAKLWETDFSQIQCVSPQNKMMDIHGLKTCFLSLLSRGREGGWGRVQIAAVNWSRQQTNQVCPYCYKDSVGLTKLWYITIVV